MASLQRYLPGNLVYRTVIQDLFISLHPFYFIILAAKTTPNNLQISILDVVRLNAHTTSSEKSSLVSIKSLLHFVYSHLFLRFMFLLLFIFVYNLYNSSKKIPFYQEAFKLISLVCLHLVCNLSRQKF